MIYRITPRQPSRFLLKVVATAGAVLVTSGCSSSSGVALNGSVTDVPATGLDDAGYDATAQQMNPSGITVFPDDAECCPGIAPRPEDASTDAAEPFCCPGSLIQPEDASIDAEPISDAGDANTLPTDAAPEDAGGPCHPVCGIIVLVDP